VSGKFAANAMRRVPPLKWLVMSHLWSDGAYIGIT